MVRLSWGAKLVVWRDGVVVMQPGSPEEIVPEERASLLGGL